jgi:CRP-like cAMP-binding protein
MPDEPSTKITHFFAQYPRVELPAKSMVVRSGTKDKNLYYIIDGCVKMSITSDTGRTLTLHFFFSESFFPLLSLLQGTIHKYDLETILPTKVYKAPVADFLQFLKENGDVAYDLNFRLLAGLQGLLQRIENSAFVPARQQIESLLLYFAKHFGSEGSPGNLQIKITHQDIAEWLGLSRENVSIHMKQLERDGVIRIQNHLIEIVGSTESAI